MAIVLILAGVFVLYELVTNQQVIGSLSSALTGTQSSSVAAVAPPPAMNVAAQGGQQQTEAAEAAGVGASLNFVPVVGPVLSAAFSAIAGGLIKASAARAAAAKNENTAVAAGVPGWDQAVSQIVAGYNSGSITLAQTIQLLQMALTNYWNEVTPQIQSGRNGCSGGSSCPGPANPNSSMNTATTAPASYCSGSIGAACCVGCANLHLGTSNMMYAVTQVDATGASMRALIPQVFASKYGGTNRAQYMVTFTKPTPASSILSAL
jgi:hypothetical protein